LLEEIGTEDDALSTLFGAPSGERSALLHLYQDRIDVLPLGVEDRPTFSQNRPNPQQRLKGIRRQCQLF
jgi:hypothetical protein